MRVLIVGALIVVGCAPAGGVLTTPEPSTPTPPEPPSVVIAELLAAGAPDPTDPEGEMPDWVELLNVSDGAVDLAGWFLTDDPDERARWPLPPRVLEPGGRLVIHAADRPVPGWDEALRAPFGLRASGEFLALVEPDGRTLHDAFRRGFPEQRWGVSYGIDPRSGAYRWFSEPTPGAPNDGPAWLGFASDPVPNVGRGFHDEPFDVLFVSDDDAVVWTTTDAEDPAEEGEVHDAPLSIDTTTCVRAVATRDGYLPSRSIAHSYLFLDDVLQQPTVPEGYPTSWQPGTTADYAMDPTVGEGAAIREALRSAPTVSLVMSVIDWFHPDEDPDTGGIYANSTIARGREWERTVSAEFFDWAHGEEIQVTAGVRVYGNASRLTSRPKHNLRLVFRGEYGAPTLDFPVFGDAPEGINGLLLRGQNGDSWIHPNVGQRREATYARDQFARSLHAAMGHVEVPQGQVHLYINGLYWGLYHTIERIEDASMVRLFGGFEEDWDVVKSSRNPNGMQVVAGSLDSWQELHVLAREVAEGARPFEALDAHLNLDAFLDFLLINFWNGNRDWDDNNFQAARPRSGGTWRFFVWDSERTLLADDYDSTTKNFADRATGIHHALLARDEYREAFAARLALRLEDGGLLSPGPAAAEFTRWTEAVRAPLLAEAARWGDTHRAGRPHLPDVDWQTEVDRRLDDYFPGRTATVLGQLEAQGLR